MQNKIKTFSLIACASALITGCEDGPVLPSFDTPAPEPDPGALVSVTLDGKVGVLLDEMPVSVRDRAADSIMNRPESFWQARAMEQFRLTQLRLNFRQFFYAEEDKKFQLPIPPEEKIHFQFSSKGPVRETVDGHDLVTMDYHFQGYLVTTVDSPEKSEPALKEIGGSWDEPIMFPVDPTLLLERTGYACMDEGGYPPDSVEPENAYLFYDDTCKVETPSAIVCHFTMPQPPVDCADAVKDKIGRIETRFHFERVAYDAAIADENRVGEVTRPEPDLAVRPDFLNNNHIVYRYFPEDACEMEEKCIGAPGWRRLLMFDALDQNVGGAPINIGAVDYYISGGDTENQLHGMYEYSACHKHYHFKHYGEFGLEGANIDAGYKVGFCLQSTDRLSNNESSPMYNPYGNCKYQGIEVGWGDRYQAGLPCQWLDITSSGVKGDPVDATLSFHSNPDEFLCEGNPVLDDKGQQVWEKTDFTTADNKPVDRPVCEFFEGAGDNDIGSTSVSIPEKGGVMTGPCKKHQVGPNRNCEFTERSDSSTCTPGEKVTLTCSVANPDKPQVVRICDYSFGMEEATTCSAYDARANSVIDGAQVKVEFTCPEKRTDVEKGGRYAIYTAAVWAADGPSEVTCTSN